MLAKCTELTKPQMNDKMTRISRHHYMQLISLDSHLRLAIIIIMSAKEKRLCFQLRPFVCLCVCLCARLFKKLRTDFDEFFEGLERGIRNNRLDFGRNLDHNPYPEIFKGYITDFIVKSVLFARWQY